MCEQRNEPEAQTSRKQRHAPPSRGTADEKPQRPATSSGIRTVEQSRNGDRHEDALTYP